MAGSILKKVKKRLRIFYPKFIHQTLKMPCNCLLFANSQGRVWYLLGSGVARDGGTRGGISRVSPFFGPKIGEDQKKVIAVKLVGF